MRLTSPAFRDGDPIPRDYTCEGEDVSPPLEWEDVPPRAKSLALVVDDPDAPQSPWVHWVVADIPITSHGIAENAGKRVHGRVGINDWRRTGWGGPCPPIGRHRYLFKLYALDRVLELPHPTKQELERAMDGHVLAEATLVGTYQKHRH